MKKALKRQQVHGITKLPSAVRVVPKMRKLDKAALTKSTKKAIAKHGLPRGVSLSVVRARGGVSVAAGWSDVKISVPKNPRRTGTWSTTAMLSFTLGKHRLARGAVPVTMKLSAAAAKPAEPANEPEPDAAPDAAPAAAQDNAVTEHLAAVAKALRDLTTTVQTQHQRIAQVEKRFGVPNSARSDERPKHSVAPALGWPMDMNNPMDRESVDKSVSFHDL